MTWLREKISQEILTHLEAGMKPWVPGADKLAIQQLSAMVPVNPVTERRYRGGNRLMLGMIAQNNGFTDPRWMTMRQANEKFDASVRKGEKASYVEYWQWSKSVATGETDTATGKPLYKRIELKNPSVFWAKVFNAEQMNGMSVLDAPLSGGIHPYDAADALLQSSGVEMTFGVTNFPAYAPDEDIVLMPAKETFVSADSYYAAAFHELVHWTDKDGRSPRNLSVYATEELVADLGAAMLCAEMGINYELHLHQSFAEEWMQAIKADKNVFFRASAMAEKASNYLMQFANAIDYKPLDTAELSDISFDMDKISEFLEEESDMRMS